MHSYALFFPMKSTFKGIDDPGDTAFQTTSNFSSSVSQDESFSGFANRGRGHREPFEVGVRDGSQEDVFHFRNMTILPTIIDPRGHALNGLIAVNGGIVKLIASISKTTHTLK